MRSNKIRFTPINWWEMPGDVRNYYLNYHTQGDYVLFNPAIRGLIQIPTRTQMRVLDGYINQIFVRNRRGQWWASEHFVS